MRTTRVSTQRFRLLSGRLSTMATRSPTLAVFSSSCATNFDVRGGFYRDTDVNDNLAAGSAGVDDGVALPGFNGPGSTWPSLGAGPDVGAFESR